MSSLLEDFGHMQVRAEKAEQQRDDLAALLRQFIYAARSEHDFVSRVIAVRDKAAVYLRRHGLEGSPLR